MFCHKCGTKLIVDNPSVRPPELSAVFTYQPANAFPGAPQKKASKRLPVIIGVAVLVVLAVIVTVLTLNQQGKTGYEATVRAYALFANLRHACDG